CGDLAGRHALHGAETEVQLLQADLRGSQLLPRLRRRLTRRDPPAVALPLPEVPGSGGAVAAVRGGPEPQEGRARPIGRVVSGTAAGAAGVGDLVVLEPLAGQEPVRQEVLLRRDSIVGRGNLPAERPFG